MVLPEDIDVVRAAIRERHRLKDEYDEHQKNIRSYQKEIYLLKDKSARLLKDIRQLSNAELAVKFETTTNRVAYQDKVVKHEDGRKYTTTKDRKPSKRCLGSKRILKARR